MNLRIRRILLTRFGISPVSILRKNQMGMINRTWLVGDDLVFTIYAFRSVGDLERICHVVQNDRSGLLPRIVVGSDGPVTTVGGKAAVLWQRIPGEHYVGPDHSRRAPISQAAHESIAESFWRLHESLSVQRSAGEGLGRVHYGAPGSEGDAERSLSEFPACLQTDYLAAYLDAPPPAIRYPALVHHDFERQNLLHAPDGKVTGIVDADSLKMGDLLYEYVHCMMNFVLTDPGFQPYHLDIYLAALKKAGMIKPEDIALIPDLLRLILAKDLISYFKYDRPPRTDLARLTVIYELGLARAEDYFSGSSVAAVSLTK